MTPARKRPAGGARNRSARSAPSRSGAAKRPARGASKPARRGEPPARARGKGASRPTRAPTSEGRSRTVDAKRGLGGDQIEGRQAVRELLLAGRRKVREVYLEADLLPSDILTDIAELAADQRVPVYEVAEGKLRSLAKTDAPQGVVARAQPLQEADLDELATTTARRLPFLLAFDGVTDPGNLGAALRSAEGAGVTGVVLPRHRSVHVTPTVAKAAAGAIEHLPVAVVGGLPSALVRLKELGVWVVGLDSAADRVLHELPVGDGPVALVLGAEGRGLSRLVRQRCDAVVRIPLQGRLASLNVAAATAVACFEVRRQRDARG